jgi:hypothetical protein
MKTEPKLSGVREFDLSPAKQESALEQAKKKILVKPEKPELEGVDLVTAYIPEGAIPV